MSNGNSGSFAVAFNANPPPDGTTVNAWVYIEDGGSAWNGAHLYGVWQCYWDGSSLWVYGTTGALVFKNQDDGMSFEVIVFLRAAQGGGGVYQHYTGYFATNTDGTYVSPPIFQYNNQWVDGNGGPPS